MGKERSCSYRAIIDPQYKTEKMLSFEKIKVDGREYSLDFRLMLEYADVANILDCGNSREIKEYQIGKGNMIYCPYPVELSENKNVVRALHAYAIKKRKHRMIFTEK